MGGRKSSFIGLGEADNSLKSIKEVFRPRMGGEEDRGGLSDGFRGRMDSSESAVGDVGSVSSIWSSCVFLDGYDLWRCNGDGTARDAPVSFGEEDDKFSKAAIFA